MAQVMNSKIDLSGVIVNEPNTCDQNGNRKIYLCVYLYIYICMYDAYVLHFVHLVAREDHSDNQNQSGGPFFGCTDLCVVKIYTSCAYQMEKIQALCRQHYHHCLTMSLMHHKWCPTGC